MKNQNAVELGKLGRSKNTEAQANASKENGKKGGRPKKTNLVCWSEKHHVWYPEHEYHGGLWCDRCGKLLPGTSWEEAIEAGYHRYFPE